MNNEAMNSSMCTSEEVLKQQGKILCNEVFLQAPLRKSCSTNNVMLQSVTDKCSHMCSGSNQSIVHTIKQSVLNEILLLLPTMITDALNAKLPAAATEIKSTEEESLSHNATEIQSKIDEYQNDMAEVKRKQGNLIQKIDGYKMQASEWIAKTKKVEEEVLPCFRDRIEALEKSWSIKEKSINNKTKNCLFTHTKIHEELEEITKIKTKLEKQLNGNKSDSLRLCDIDQSQKFVAAEYDKIKMKQTQYESEIKEMKKKLERQEQKSERTANYSRLECLEVDGVPVIKDCEGNENCKWQIIEICKELNYWIPEHTISTAHRKKQHFSKTGPPPIIVKFNCKDIRNDIFKLRHQLKDKFVWYCFDIKKLYINESLTPDASKLFYSTRIFTKEMQRIHGKIFSWTYKGEIYIRKSIDGAPKRKITCLADLTQIKSGHISIDPPNRNPVRSPGKSNPTITQRTDDARTADIINAMSTLNICN